MGQPPINTDTTPATLAKPAVFDECTGCTAREDMAACQSTPCHHHDSWLVQQLAQRSTLSFVPTTNTGVAFVTDEGHTLVP